ncbi:MAG: 1-(5-phosphoribosyl)-5-[Clostridia bacterium]|nr:1-(5-phosphoribosyl)-5-[(5-phosphoribosylamino)methylideneamino]imidazole-4-carboxamide isomerase [Clostridia bacterium]
MYIFPAIDLYGGKAVRLQRGDYNKMTVYSDDPVELGYMFADAGAQFLHTVDLEGAKDGTTPNLSVVAELAKKSGLKVQVGGGIRTVDTVERYLDAGVERVIIGTAAVTDPDFLYKSVERYGSHIAVGVDIKDGMAAIRGWMEKSELSCYDLFDRLTSARVQTVICTDISKDGMLSGTNVELYRDLMNRYTVDIIASGGVTTVADIEELRNMNMYGAIVGKAIYQKTIDLREAIEVANK